MDIAISYVLFPLIAYYNKFWRSIPMLFNILTILCNNLLLIFSRKAKENLCLILNGFYCLLKQSTYITEKKKKSI